MGLRKKKLAKEWVEWLDDEPPITDEEAHEQWAKHEQNTVVGHSEVAKGEISAKDVYEPTPDPKPVQKAPEDKNIAINIHFKKPDLSAITSRLKLPKLNPKQLKLGGVALGALVVIVIGFKLLHRGKGSGDLRPTDGAKPNFQTVLPDKKESETTSGKLQYDPEKQVASFTDTIDYVEVTVSQQPLPEAFKKDQAGELQKLAEQISAKDVINESNPKAYLGNSVKGPQTVVFVKNNLLIFIHSVRSIDKPGWAEYITKLQ